ncbi:response regulator [Rhodocytophaga rosea]|uniref:Response regulator n=1 Tax=Rhodocytophaga rosea TaxID=2704465 RepID=A0A6C0GC78_9BACT|nr:response regulator [Rhodocytophaga rosea]QHT65497.1 response regulator [Rhodocytophaga rosea]
MKAQPQFENVLLVDDDEISCIVSTAILKGAKIGSQIQSVYNGNQALDFLTKQCLESKERNFCPALLFLDLNMPVMDGFEFLEAFTHHEKLKELDLSIVVLTSSAYSKDMEKAYRYPIAGFITKPITPEKLQSIFK